MRLAQTTLRGDQSLRLHRVHDLVAEAVEAVRTAQKRLEVVPTAGGDVPRLQCNELEKTNYLHEI